MAQISRIGRGGNVGSSAVLGHLTVIWQFSKHTKHFKHLLASGRWGGWNSSGMEGAMLDGKAAAEKIKAG